MRHPANFVLRQNAIGSRSRNRAKDRPICRVTSLRTNQEMLMRLLQAPWRFLAVLTVATGVAVTASSAFAKTAVVGPVAFEVPDDFTNIAGPPPSLHEEASGITLEASELPLQALQEFKGPDFLEFLASRGYTNAAYPKDGLKRSDPHTYVLADANGKQGPESRFLLVLGGKDRAAIVTAYVPKSQLTSGHASRAAIEAILASASIVPASPAKP